MGRPRGHDPEAGHAQLVYSEGRRSVGTRGGSTLEEVRVETPALPVPPIPSTSEASVLLNNANPSLSVGSAVTTLTWPWCEHVARSAVSDSPPDTTAASLGSNA